MARDRRQEWRDISLMAASKYFRNKLGYLSGLLRRTRLPFLRSKGWWVNSMQVGMLANLYEVQQAVFQGKELEITSQPDKKDAVQKKWRMNDRLATAIQVIADGIAWRALGYKRASIRLLSENMDPGPLSEHEIKTFVGELQHSKQTLIVNDLTRCLRIADLTYVHKDGRVILVDSKKGGKSLKDVRDILAGLRSGNFIPNKQNQRHLIAQFAFIDRQVRLPTYSNGRVSEQLYEIVELDFKIRHHLRKVARLINIANRAGFAVAMLEPGYMVSVTAFDKAVSKQVNFQRVFDKYKEEYERVRRDCFSEGDAKVMSLSTYDALAKENGHFPRNVTPISVLPFSDRDCARIMLGFTKIDTYYDLHNLKRAFERRGWQVKELSWGEGDTYAKPSDKSDLSSYGPRHEEALVNVSKGPFHIVVPVTQLMGALATYYATDFVVDAAEAEYKHSERDKRNGFVLLNYLGERQVLR